LELLLPLGLPLARLTGVEVSFVEEGPVKAEPAV
jgi:hypothetical protein